MTAPGLCGDVVSPHERVRHQVRVIERLSKVEGLRGPALGIRVSSLVLVQPPAEFGKPVGQAEEVVPEAAPGVVQTQLDDLDMFLYDANQIVRPHSAIGLNVGGKNSLQVGQELGARREGRGRIRSASRYKTQVGLGRLQDFGE